MPNDPAADGPPVAPASPSSPARGAVPRHDP